MRGVWRNAVVVRGIAKVREEAEGVKENKEMLIEKTENGCCKGDYEGSQKGEDGDGERVERYWRRKKRSGGKREKKKKQGKRDI